MKNLGDRVTNTEGGKPPRESDTTMKHENGQH